jgi:hypothetical protein
VNTSHLSAGLAAFILVGTAQAQFSFAPTASVPTGTQPSGLAAGDFDGDGDRDLATTADGPDRIIILLNNGAGGFAAGPSSLLPNSSSPQDLIAGDFDGDASPGLGHPHARPRRRDVRQCRQHDRR